MKVRLFIACLAIITAGTVIAQDKAQKVQVPTTCTCAAELGKKFSLDDNTQKKFEAVFNEYCKSCTEIREKYPIIRHAGLSDEEIRANTDNQLNRQESRIELKKNLVKELEKILTPRQIQIVLKHKCPQSQTPKLTRRLHVEKIPSVRCERLRHPGYCQQGGCYY